MVLNTGQWVVIIVAAVLILGYILGYYSNRRIAQRTLSWLHQGLSSLGDVSVGEKLPGMATGGRLEVTHAAAPLKSVEAIYLLAPRENLIFWIFNLLQGRSDEFIIWVSYQAKPDQSIEVARKGDRQFVKRLQATDKPKLILRDAIGNLQIGVEEIPLATLPDKVIGFVQRYKQSILRLALRPDKPHLFLRLNSHLMQTGSCAELFAALAILVE